MLTHSSEPLNKRLVFVTGDKGGVGKSFMARTLVQHNLDMHQTCHAYDIDPVNPSLHQYYPENTIQLDRVGVEHFLPLKLFPEYLFYL